MKWGRSQRAGCLLAILILIPGWALADTASTPTFSASAVVPATIQMNVGLAQNTTDGPALSNMNFGTLQVAGTGALRSSPNSSTGTGSAVAIISAIGSGIPYAITQTGSAPTTGVDTIPAGACTVVPVYSSADNTGASFVGTLGAPGSWVATNKVLYTSDAEGSGRVIQAHYAITDDPASGGTAAVPSDQPPGTYSSTVTFTITTS